jgi:hypothetical protein
MLAQCGQLAPGAGLRHPPPRPGAACPRGADVDTFAIDSIDLGESDWQTLGYDLDGKATTKDSTDVCLLYTGAPKSNQADGEEGIDDAFGAIVTPVLQSALADPTPSATLTSAIEAGRFTLQIQVTGLDQTPTQTCHGLQAQTFTSDAYDGGTPAFDTTTDWPVMSEALQNGSDISSGAKASFGNAYIVNGTFVAGSTGGVTVPLYLVLSDGTPVTLLVHQALLTFDVVSANEIGSGVLAGVLDTDELMKATGWGHVCLGGGINDWPRQANDILLDGTNPPGVPCNAISFAIGFHARRVANPTKVAPPLPPPPPPCP